MASQGDSIFDDEAGVEFVKMEDICDEFKSRSSPPAGAKMPAEAESILKC